MELIWFVVVLVLSGLIVGALGRLAIPGPDPMGIGMTILVGIGGSLIGGLVGGLIFGRNGVPFIFAVGGAALLVWIIRKRRGPRAV